MFDTNPKVTIPDGTAWVQKVFQEMKGIVVVPVFHAPEDALAHKVVNAFTDLVVAKHGKDNVNRTITHDLNAACTSLDRTKAVQVVVVKSFQRQARMTMKQQQDAVRNVGVLRHDGRTIYVILMSTSFTDVDMWYRTGMTVFTGVDREREGDVVTNHWCGAIGGEGKAGKVVRCAGAWGLMTKKDNDTAIVNVPGRGPLRYTPPEGTRVSLT